MSNHMNLSLPENFDNQVRLFPLPNLVLFPGIVQALHLFEPRYRELIKAALATDELIRFSRTQSSKTVATTCFWLERSEPGSLRK